MEAYNFYERNKKTIEDLPNWDLDELIGCINLVSREIRELRPGEFHPNFLEMLVCSLVVLEENIILKIKQQHAQEVCNA